MIIFSLKNKNFNIYCIDLRNKEFRNKIFDTIKKKNKKIIKKTKSSIFKKKVKKKFFLTKNFLKFFSWTKILKKCKF